MFSPVQNFFVGLVYLHRSKNNLRAKTRLNLERDLKWESRKTKNVGWVLKLRMGNLKECAA